MNSKELRVSLRMPAVLFATALGCVAVVRTEAPSSGRPDLSGTWELDMYLSDHPAQILRAIRIDTGLPLEESPRSDPERGSGRREIVRPDSRDQKPSAHPSPDALTAEDRKKIGEVLHNAQFAPTKISITQTADAITFTQFGVVQTYSTTGKPERHVLDAGTVKRTATWEGPTLVIKYSVGRAGNVTYGYVLTPRTQQLLVRVNVEQSSGEAGPFEIKLVYDRVER